jgi:hypothetical protein
MVGGDSSDSSHRSISILFERSLCLVFGAIMNTEVEGTHLSRDGASGANLSKKPQKKCRCTFLQIMLRTVSFLVLIQFAFFAKSVTTGAFYNTQTDSIPDHRVIKKNMSPASNSNSLKFSGKDDHNQNNRRRVVSYSLYGGNNPRYTTGAIANANLMPSVYPGWEMHIYHDKSIPESLLENLGSRSYVVLWPMDGSPIKNPREWRFLVASDPTVERYVVRDIDSRLSQREKAAVDEWIAMGTQPRFHVIRDHPSHTSFPISAGMWGGTHDAVPDMEVRLLEGTRESGYIADQDFLKKQIWPLAQKSLLQHDSFSCDQYGGGRPFPTPRIGWEHIGSVYIDGKMRQGDVDLLRQASVVERCSLPKGNWTTAEPRLSSPEPTCFPRASGHAPERKGKILTGFASALTALAASSDVLRILEIGTWYGGGSTKAFVDGMQHKSNCITNTTHHCCHAFVITFEVFKPAWEHSRLYHQNNPVWLVLGTTVGLDDMLTEDEIPKEEKGEHFRLYYKRDQAIMQTNEPQLAKYCRLLSPDVVLIDGNEYTGWGEFEVALTECQPRYLALHDTGTLKTHKVEAFIHNFPENFIEVASGLDAETGWSIYRVGNSGELDLPYPTLPTPTSRHAAFTVWSNDLHISPIANIKKALIPKGVKFIDKSLSGHCHLTETCATDLKILTPRNAQNPDTETRKQFVEAYRNDPEFKTVDIVMCFHPSAMCEVFMPLNKRIFVIATTRYEMGRYSADAWQEWNANLKSIALDPANVVAANNLYDAKYIEYFTGIVPKLLPSATTMEIQYAPTSLDILVPALHSPGARDLSKLLKSVSPRFVDLHQKYGHYSYEQLCENTAILHLPYQTSIMSLFEQYAMGIPVIVPSPEFLWYIHDKYDLVTERTWERVRTGKRPSGSVIPGVNATLPDPNNDFDKDAFLHWIRFADFYQWPNVLTFESWEHLGSLLDTTDWIDVSTNMLAAHREQVRDIDLQWESLLFN